MATSITTRQHLTHWLANVTCGPGTRRSYLAAIHQLLSFITGDPPLAAISLKEFRAYLCTLHIKDKTATKYLYTIRAILRSAWKAGIITQKPEKVFPIISGEITHIKPRLSHGSSLPFFLSPVQREAIGQHIQLMIDQGHSVEKAAAKIASAYQISSATAKRCYTEPTSTYGDAHLAAIRAALRDDPLHEQFVSAPDPSSSDSHAALEEIDPQTYDALRNQIGTATLAAFFRHLVPQTIPQRIIRVRNSLTLRKDQTLQWVTTPRGQGWRRAMPPCGTLGADCPATAAPFVLADNGDHIIIADQDGNPTTIQFAACRVINPDGTIHAIHLETSVDNLLQRTCDAGNIYVQIKTFTLGEINPTVHYRKLVAYASIFSRGAVNDQTGSALAALFGETRAAWSHRTSTIISELLPDDRAGFAGKRKKPDPRKGTKKLASHAKATAPLL